MIGTLLDRLIYAEISASFAFGLGLFTVLLVMNHLFYLARLVIQQGIAVQIALELMAYKIPYFVAFSVPMGVLLATVLGISRLSEHNEIAALRVAGVSLPRMAVPVMVVGVLAALGTIVFSEGIVSQSDDQYRAVFSHVGSRSSELRPVENLFFQTPTPKGTALYHAQRYDPQARTLDDVTIFYLDAGQPLHVLHAPRATYVSENDWTFHDVDSYTLSGRTPVVGHFDVLTVVISRSLQDLTLPPKQPSDMTLRELATEILNRKRPGVDTRPYVGELHVKVATAASCVVFALVAFPLSLRPHRSGPSIALGLSILVLVAYYAIEIPTQLASDAHLLSPVLAAWLPDLVVGCSGVALLARAAR